MRKFCKINPDIWRSRKFRSLKGDEKIVYIYLLTNPSVNSTGCYWITIETISGDVCLPVKRVREVLDTLCDTVLTRWDEEENTVYLENWHSFNGPDNISHALKIWGEFDLIKSSKLRLKTTQDLLDHIKSKSWRDEKLPILISELGEKISQLKTECGQLYDHPVDTVSDTVSETLYPTQETRDRRLETKDIIKKDNTNVLSKKSVKQEILPPDRFDEFWATFPKQRAGAKQKARAAWKQALKRASEQEIISGLHEYAQSDEVARGFAKGAAAWLNDDRWTNDYSIAPMTGAGAGRQHEPSLNEVADAAIDYVFKEKFGNE